MIIQHETHYNNMSTTLGSLQSTDIYSILSGNFW